MKKAVRVFALNSQQYDDYADQVSTNSVGEYSVKGNTHTITYTEKLEGNALVNNTLILKKEVAELHRTGAVNSQMFFDKGKTTDTEYLTNYGAVDFKIMTTRYNVVIDEEHVTVNLQYELMHNGQKVSRNHLQIGIDVLPDNK